MTGHPRVSIVLEWENVLLSENDRATALLRALRRQTADLAAESDDRPAALAGQPSFELIIVYDETKFDSSTLTKLLERCMGREDDLLRRRLLPTGDGGYYKVKNFGAAAATGEIIVFVDSDVIPEPGWLLQILTTLDDPAVQIVVGNSYIEPAGLVGKVFALTWFFPPRSDDSPVQNTLSFFANNLAMRKEFSLQYPFPDLGATSRGSCIVLASQLAEANIPVFYNPRARVAHPAPNGFTHICKRALTQGRDRLLRERKYGNHWSASWLASVSRLLRHWADAAWKICTGFHKAGLQPLLIPPAVAIAAFYYLLYWAGEMMTHLRIPAIRRIRV